MTLPDEDVLQLLRDRFVLGARNIERDRHVGTSHGYRCTQSAVGTTNGAGARNVQILVLAADSTVVHALPGFWHPQELADELRLALVLHELHADDRTPAARLAMFRALHDAAARAEPTARDAWQPFDASAELMRAAKERRDTVAQVYGGGQRLLPIRRIVHDRLAAQPFPRLADFDLEAFVDYGRPYYDNNSMVEEGRRFRRAERNERRREQERAKAEKAELALASAARR